jgi:hypothetical protein
VSATEAAEKPGVSGFFAIAIVWEFRSCDRDKRKRDQDYAIESREAQFPFLNDKEIFRFRLEKYGPRFIRASIGQVPPIVPLSESSCVKPHTWRLG